ncbi:hypothetical protein niasHS_005417 [Heterodera schachtii]|uniref:Uncharacterized protein n=1 Tax=Heterodera schachtii TaxID=97005 RepID=A0ABD2J982_HETSC
MKLRAYGGPNPPNICLCISLLSKVHFFELFVLKFAFIKRCVIAEKQHFRLPKLNLTSLIPKPKNTFYCSNCQIDKKMCRPLLLIVCFTVAFGILSIVVQNQALAEPVIGGPPPAPPIEGVAALTGAVDPTDQSVASGVAPPKQPVVVEASQVEQAEVDQLPKSYGRK